MQNSHKGSSNDFIEHAHSRIKKMSQVAGELAEELGLPPETKYDLLSIMYDSTTPEYASTLTGKESLDDKNWLHDEAIQEKESLLTVPSIKGNGETTQPRQSPANPKGSSLYGRRLSSRRTIIGLSTILSSVGVIFWSIVTSRLDDAFTWLWGQTSNSLQQNFWPWIIVNILVVIVCTGAFLYHWRSKAILNQSLQLANKMLALDDFTLRMLASWATLPSSRNHEEQLKLILRETLKEAITIFDGDVERAAILLPDSTDASYLTCWEQVEMSPESIAAMRFYIGGDQQRQRSEGGVAGASFLSGKILVGHMDNPNGHWICKDQEQYIKFPGTRPYNPYRSFVNVPIKGLNTGANMVTCLGVLCFDSKREDTFDSKAIKPTLLTLARHVAATILISKYDTRQLLAARKSIKYPLTADDPEAWPLSI